MLFQLAIIDQMPRNSYWKKGGPKLYHEEVSFHNPIFARRFHLLEPELISILFGF